MPKKNPKKKEVKLGWNPTVKNNYQSLKMVFKNELVFNKQMNFIIQVLEQKGLIVMSKKTIKHEDGSESEEDYWKVVGEDNE